MKKTCALFFLLLLIGLATPAFADWELGVSVTPLPEGSSGEDSMSGFHAAYGWSLLYASLDVFAVPGASLPMWAPSSAASSPMRAPHDSISGYLGLFDVGVRVVLKPFIGFAELGVNGFYNDSHGFLPGGFGSNLRVGAGIRFGWWGVSVTGTSLFASLKDLEDTLGAFGNPATRADAWDDVVGRMVASIQFTFYFR
jgi:hypothetical protein